MRLGPPVSTDEDTHPTPSPARLHIRVAVSIALVALALAVASEWTGYLPWPWYFISILWGPWAAAAFVTGRLCRNVVAGVVAGVAVIGLGLAADLAYRELFYGRDSARALWMQLPPWMLLAAIVGCSLGAAGSLSRREGQWIGVLGWSLGVAVVLTEVGTIVLGARGIPSVVSTIDGAIAAAIAFVAVRHVPLRWLIGLTAAFAVALIGLLPLGRRLFPVF